MYFFVSFFDIRCEMSYVPRRTLMNSLTKQLIELGLTEKQALIYIAVLELGNAPVTDISRRALVKRPTTYVILRELEAIGLVTQLSSGNTTLFLAQKPANLGNRLQQQLKVYQSIKSELGDLYLKENPRPSASYYSGADEVRGVYEMFLVEHSDVDLVWSDLERFSEEVPGVLERLLECIQDGGYTVRELVTRSPFHLEYAANHTSRFHDTRVLNEKFEFYDNSALFGSALITTSLTHEPFAVLIDSKHANQSYRSLFDVAWSVSHPVR